MKVISQNAINLQEIANVLKEGKTIVYPTETCYGLGCDASNQLAVDKIFDIKQRQLSKSLLMVASNMQMMMEYIEWSPKLQEVADKYWPSALTVVVKAKPDCELAAGVIAFDGTIAFRVSSHPLVLQLCDLLGEPLVSTSANIALEESPYDIKNVLLMFGESKKQPDIVIDAGTLPHKSPSTVVKIEGGGLSVLRQGEVVVD